MTDNPFFEPWATPYGIAPFGKIAPEHFGAAFERAMATHAAEIERIAADVQPPDFDNTIAALERAGQDLRRVNGVFWNLAGADTNESLQEVERNIAPRLARHQLAIVLNAPLFRRIDALHAQRHELPLDAEQQRVLDLTHKSFVRGGARLAAADRERLGAITERLAVLGTAFGQNVLADEKDFVLPLDAEGDLAGLPANLRAVAAQAAAERGMPGAHAITLARALVEPFLTFSSRRDLREKAFAAWKARGEHEGAHDNRPIVAETVRLRAERAALLGFDTFAAFKLDETMAKTPAAVRNLLDRVWERALIKVGQEEQDLQAVAAREGSNTAIAPSDWRYYAEKLRRMRHDYDDADVKQHLALDNVIAAAFDTAGRLFGITVSERGDVPVYHPDVRAFDVSDKGGRHLALFLGDYFARPSKRSGAWSSSFRGQHKLDGADQRPIVVNVMNFARSPEGEPTLLSLDDARTLFHEFGHALHSMLSEVTYPSVAGTSVARDFVEFPSQLYEHWLLRPEVLRRFARHSATGEPMPDDLLQRIEESRTFGAGATAIEYCASAIVDMEFHSLQGGATPENLDPIAFERDVLDRIGLPAAITMRHRTPHFAHVFSGDGYSAGYYSYLWSEMLDADGFGAFEEAGDVFDPALAARLRTEVLEAGNTREPADAYMAFRGRMPSVETLLKQRGLA